MFKLILSMLIVQGLWAKEFAPNKDCKACHTEIYKEFYGSVHANSTPQKDPIHNAVWQKHPQKKQNKYGCGKCHTPTAKKFSVPTAGSQKHQDGISCAYCHRIESIKHHPKSNINITTDTQKAYFGTLKEHIASPYHKIITTGNEHMKNGNVCIGCHSHKMNKHKLNVCSTNIKNEMDKANCVSCHMPKVKGSVSKLHETPTHTFHGFAGTHYHPEMLAKYVSIKLNKQNKGFNIEVKNHSSHALLLHPLRVGVLKVSVTRDGKTTKLKNEIFVRVIGKDKKPAMPWSATSTLKDTVIKADENRVINYNFELKKGDKVDVILGWFLVNPKAVKKLNLQNEKIATKFITFKKESFEF